MWSFWEHINDWWDARHLPNLLLVHYADLIGNKREEAERIAHFLGLDWTSSVGDMVCQYSSLDYMKFHSDKFQPPGRFKPNTFINKGINGRWKDLLTDRQIRYYEDLIYQKLEPDCADWIMNGGHLSIG